MQGSGQTIHLGVLQLPEPAKGLRIAAQAVAISLKALGYFFNAAPYILTLFIMIASAQSKSAAREVPGELSINK